MIRTSANTENTLWVNASRNKTLSNPTYMMSITHQVNQNFVRRFIPQNVTPQSGTTIENPRVDLFNITFSDSYENLTGGTRAWYYTYPPSVIAGYQNNPNAVNLKGTGNSYPRMAIWDSDLFINNVMTIMFDWSDVNDRMDDVNDTGFTVNINDIQFTGGTTNISREPIPGTSETIDRALLEINFFTSPVPLNEIEKISYTGTTTGGTVMTNTIYVANGLQVSDNEPWTYYGDVSVNTSRSYPITFLGKTTVDIEDYGWYYYKIYEQTSPINLNPSLTTDVVDEGILYVIPPDTDESVYTGYSNNNITIYE